VPGPRPTPVEVVAKLVARAKTRGLGEIVTLGVARTREGINSDDELIFYSVDTATVPLIERDDVTCRRATPADGAAFAHEIGTESPRTFAARLSEKTDCYLVLAGDRIVHSSWVTSGGAWTRELRAYIVPPDGAAYVYESFTGPEARGKGAYPLALTKICADLVATGITHLWVAVEAGNASSQRAVTKAGFAERARIPFGRHLGRLSVGSLPSEPDFPAIDTKVT
jgi:ribosomal protein S18 acetylase RimI-like enzyme